MTGVVLAVHDEIPKMPVKDALRVIDPEASAGRRTDRARPLDLRLLLLAPRRSSARHAPTLRRNPAGKDLLANRRRPRRLEAAFDRRLRRRRFPEGRSDAGRSPRFPPPASNARFRWPTKFSNRSNAKAGLPWSIRRISAIPLRAPSAKLRIAPSDAVPQGKLPKAERELLAYLALHPGSHNLSEVEAQVHNASTAARSLARKQLVTLTAEPIAITAAPPRAPHELNSAQRRAFDLIEAGIGTGQVLHISDRTASLVPARLRST